MAHHFRQTAALSLGLVLIITFSTDMTLAADSSGMQAAESYVTVTAPLSAEINTKISFEKLFPETEEWMLLLVNERNPLEKDVKPQLVEVSGGQQVDKRIEEPLKAMLEAMREEGLRPLVCSGYRSIERQRELFSEYIEDRIADGWSYEDAFYKAKRRIAIPGTSEHQTGLAVDIVGMSHQSLDDTQAFTDEAVWLREHCAEYGFILRYPEDKTEITGIEYESWHFRYVGTEAADYIMEREMVLEEFIDLTFS